MYIVFIIVDDISFIEKLEFSLLFAVIVCLQFYVVS